MKIKIQNWESWYGSETGNSNLTTKAESDHDKLTKTIMIMMDDGIMKLTWNWNWKWFEGNESLEVMRVENQDSLLFAFLYCQQKKIKSTQKSIYPEKYKVYTLVI